MIDFNNLTEKELKSIIKNANKRIDEIEKEKEIKRQRKLNYHLVQLPKKYDINYRAFYENVIKLEFDENTKTAIKNIAENVKFEILPKKTEIFPCPVCGEMELYVSDYLDIDLHRYHISCGNCNFSMAEECSSEKDAWYAFTEYLVKEGYLDKMPNI